MNWREIRIHCVHVTLGVTDGGVEFLHNVLQVHRCPPVPHLLLLVPAPGLHDQLGHLTPGVQAGSTRLSLMCPRLS